MEHIVEDLWVSTGPKSYASANEDKKEICKIKGFVLNYENNKHLNLRGLSDIFLGDNQRITVVNEQKITRKKGGFVINKYEEKQFTLCYDKRVPVKDHYLMDTKKAFL
jgi:hypothetical protein